MHNALLYQFILCRLQGKDCCRQGRILRHCVPDELTKIKIFLSKISTPFLTFLIPFAIIRAEFWHNEYPQNFQTPLCAVTFFQPTRVLRKLSSKIKSCKVRHSIYQKKILKNANSSDIYSSQTVTFLYLYWYFWCQNIKLKNSMNQKYVSNTFFPCLQRIRMRRSKR